MKLASTMFAIALLGTAACDAGNVNLGSGGADAADDESGDPGPDAAPVDDNPRATEGLHLLYEFGEGTGTVVADSSGLEPSFDLTIQDLEATQWIAEGGLEITAPTIISNPEPPARMGQACQDAGEITLEAWMQPAAVNQNGPARILTFSTDTGNRNFTLGQNDSEADVRLRATETNANGQPSTASVDKLLSGGTQHVVYVRDAIAEEGRLYIDGEPAGIQPVTGSFENWDLGYLLALGNELTLDRPWRGKLFLVAVYCGALSEDQILQNYEAGY